MATHSSILAWRIPWTEKPGGLTGHGLQSDMTEVPEHPQWTNNPLIMSCSVAKKTKVNKDPQILL